MPRVALIVLVIIFGTTGFFTLASEQTNQNAPDTVYNTAETTGLYEKLATTQEHEAQTVYRKSYIVPSSQIADSKADHSLESRQFIRFVDTPWY